MSACTSPTADVVFVVDGSGSIGSSNFREVKSFIGSVVDAFDISSTKVRVALIQFSNNAVVEFNLRRYSNKRSVKAAVAGLPYNGGGKQTRVLLKQLNTVITRIDATATLMAAIRSYDLMALYK